MSLAFTNSFESSDTVNLSRAMSALVGATLPKKPAIHIKLPRAMHPPLTKVATGQESFGGIQRTTVVKNGMVLPSTLQRIALLEDSQIEADGLVRLFQENGYKVVSFNSGVEFLKNLERDSFDLFILDWNVPDMSGIEVLQNLRNELALTTPVMMLTSRASEYDIVQALNRGADDYLQKPWQPFELVARVNALLRRQRYVQTLQDERYSDFVLDNKLHHVTHKGQTVRLSNKEFLLIQLLLRHLGSPVSRAHIAQTIWHDDQLEARTLDVHVSRLRQKLNLTVAGGFSLASIYGYGYRLEKLTERQNETPVVTSFRQKTDEAKAV